MEGSAPLPMEAAPGVQLSQVTGHSAKRGMEDADASAARGGSKKRAALSSLTNQEGKAPLMCKDSGASAPAAGRRVTRSMSSTALPSAALALAPPGPAESAAPMAEDAAAAVPAAGGDAEPAAQMDIEDACKVAQVDIQSFRDIDRGQEDPTVVVEYVDEIYTYLRSLETKFRPKPGYMRKQRDINHGMRTILVDWLVEVAEEYKLNTHTLYIAVAYIDRFLSEMSVQRGKLQLVGVTSMLLASKYEEIYPPAVDEFVYITDNTYTREQILKMENLVLKVLQFDMGAVTAYSFAERFLKAANANEKTRHLTQYLMELTLQDGERYLKYKPSVAAASCIVVALHTLGMPVWTPTLQHYSDLRVEDISECVANVHHTFTQAAAEQQQAVREKYADPKFSRISTLTIPATHPPAL